MLRGRFWQRAAAGGRAWRARRVMFGLVASAALASASARASGVDPTKVSLPKGPGSIEGLASADFSPSLSTGAASYEVPIAVPPGSAGFGPKLSLSYDSGGGVTEIGIGWRISGTPKIRRRTEDGLPHFDDTDSFELVGVGIPSALVEVSKGIFRPAFEDGSFVRVERSPDGEMWEARTKAGITLRFGGDGFTEHEGDHLGSYLLREEIDRHGHVIAYEWDATEGHALPTRVVWNTFDAASTNEVRFEYETRPDRHRRFSAGFRESITRRLIAIEVAHGGALVRRYELRYGEGIHSLLHSVAMVGRDGTSRLPESQFDYTEASLTPSSDRVTTMSHAPGQSPKDPDVTLADLDGDGLPDLLVGRAGQFRTYLNHDGKRWLSPTDWGSASPSVSLSATGVELADLDADGAPDLVAKSGTDSFRYFPHPTGSSFGAPKAIATVPSFSFEDANVRLADMDGDRRTDVVVTTDAGLAIGYNRGGSDWTDPAVVGVVDVHQPLLFSDGHTSLCDVNGDRVEDLCSLHSGGMSYWLGRGRGAFEAADSAGGVPEFDPSAPYRLIDLNGDGWVDLVRVGVTAIDVAIAVGEGRFGAVHTLDGTPERTPSTSVEFADMNASGSTDIVWVDVTGDGQASWRYLELFPMGRAGLLRRIDNGLGKVQTIEYEPVALHAARARDGGKAWTTRINVPLPVVSRVTVDASLGDPALVTELTYRNGAYDPIERTFAAFGGCTKRQLGDAWTPTLVSELTFDSGLLHRELRGAPLVDESRDESGLVFSRTMRSYASRVLTSGLDGTPVQYSFLASELADSIEGGTAPRSTLSEFEQDAFGNVVEERHWGEVSGGNRLIGNDETMITRTFANDADEWLLGLVATEETSDATGRRVAFTRKYYDGEPFRGLELGKATRGDVSREEAWVGPDDDTFELVVATQYDPDGLPLETRDGVGGGRFFEWASDHTSIASERVKLESPTVLIERAEVDGAFGALLSAVDYAGQKTAYEYDPFGRLTKVVKPGDTIAQPTVTYAYEAHAPLSRVVTETRVLSGKDDLDRSEKLVDGAGRERGTLTRDGDRWILAGVSLLDARGNARRTLLPRGVARDGYAAPPLLEAAPRGSDVFHDALGREIRTRSPLGIESKTQYAAFETRHWDGGQADPGSPYEHTPVVERKDGLGRVVAHVRTLGGKEVTARYGYDAAGSLISRTDPEGNVTRYEHDGRGRRIAVSDPDLGDTRFSYDATGNMRSRIYPDGKTARFTFDLAGRSLTEDWNADGLPELSRTWDVAPKGTSGSLYLGKLARVAEPSGAIEHTYDERGRVTASTYEIDGATYVVRSEYDAQDRERLHVYPDGSSIEIRRNARGQISGYGAAVDVEYGDDGVEIERRFNTGARVRSDYDDDRRRTEFTFAARDGSIVEHLRWGYDQGGNLTSLSELRAEVDSKRSRSETYTYDNLYRLSGVAGAWGGTDYRYSASGNLTGRTSTVSSQSIETISYGDRPHLPSAFDGKPVTADARGRMTSDGARTYTWNDIDQLVAVSRSDGGSVESAYGDEGVRRLRVEHRPDGTSTTTHFIDGWTEAKDGKLVRYIVHGGQRIVKLSDDNGVAGNGSVTPSVGSMRPHAASAISGALLCVLAFALTLVARMLSRLRRSVSSEGARVAVRAAGAGAGLALVVTSAAPIVTATGVVLLVALCLARSTAVAKLSRCVVAGLGLLFAVSACGDDASTNSAAAVDVPAAPHGSIRQLTDGDTLIATDLIGSVLGETTGTGTPKSEFAVYPYGATRYDTSQSTWKFAGTPRDAAVDLDHMGARFYAPELGVWTSGDPIAFSNPEHLVTADFAAANPYAYANLTPVIAADRDGHFAWIVAMAGAAAAFEAWRQYHSEGRISSPGRILAAGIGGAVFGSVVALNPVVGLETLITTGVRAGLASGLAERLVSSGGRTAGTLGDAAADAAKGVGGLLLGRGVSALLAKGAPQATRALGATSRANSTQTHLVIGRGKDLAASGALQAGEYRLQWPSKLPDFKAEWKMNAGLLRAEMQNMRPIRDASPTDFRGIFLNAERALLGDRGWKFDESTSLWNPPNGNPVPQNPSFGGTW